VEPAPSAYCGPPSVPADWLERWNLDPALLAGWLAIALAWEWAARRQRDAAARSRARAFRAGWGLALAAWVSPLCALGVALFSARVAQHMLLALVAAPLLAQGWPQRAENGPGRAIAACAGFAALTWFWHVPGPYEATFRSDAAYWAMHASLLAAALCVWRILLARTASGFAVPCAAALATCFQMSLLGAVFTFAPNPLFESHRLAAPPWGLSALEDQQLGGLVLWVPGCVAFLLAGIAPVAAWLKLQDRETPRAAL
jgi:putative membrane protein